MNTLIKTLLWLATIILLLLGIWPIALLIIIGLIISNYSQKEKELEKLRAENPKLQRDLETKELKSENEKLRQELADQAVRRAMDKAEQREKGR